jgi:aminopeptidase N
VLLGLLALFAYAAPEPPRPVSDAPGAVQPPRSWDVEHLHLAVRVDVDAGEVQGTTTHRIAPLARAAATLRLHQVGLRIDAVRVDGAKVEGWHTGPDFLDIPVPPGVPHEVQVDFQARPETGLHFRGGGPDAVREAWSQGEGEDNRHWFPSWDHPNDRFTFSADLIARSDLVAVANGDRVAREPERDGGRETGWTRWSYRLDQPLVNYLVAIGVGEYEEHTLEGARVPMAILAPRSMSRDQATAGFDQVVPMLGYFDALLGTPYPYPNYRQLVVQRFLYGGMENTTLTILSDELAATRPWMSAERAESVAAHELAHQWFGDLLTCYGWRELWLNEGFATYYTNRWWEHSRGEAFAAVRRRGVFDGGLATEGPMAPRSWSARDGQDNDGVYVRGASVLYLLETYLGRDVFDAGIRLYVARHRDRLVETDDLRRALEDVSGEHLGWIFDGWVHGTGAPSFRVRHDFTARDGGPGGEVRVTLAQTTEGRPWHVVVDVEIGTKEGTIVRRVPIGAGQTTLLVDVPEPPRWVIADPQRAVIARWDQEQRPEQWAAAATHAPRWDTRLTAIDALGGQPVSPATLAPLGEVLASASFDPAIRGVAITSLGRIGTDEARALLFRHLDHEDWQDRERTIRALAQFKGVEAVRVQLERRLADPHPEVAGAALEALASVDPDPGLAAARRAIKGRYTEDRAPSLSAAVQVVGQRGELSDLASILPWAAPEVPRSLRTTAFRALGRLIERHAAEPQADRARSRATASVAPALDDQDLRTRQSAIGALARLGDETAIPRLRALAASTRLPGLADAARDAATAIRRRDDPKPEAPAPDDLEALRERLDQAEKRLDQLEIRR